MPENILVVEYEPRYTDRVRAALAGQPFTPVFAKDGDEAIRCLDSDPPKLIVLSSVVPKISTSELIRAIRSRDGFGATPILLTVSGYSGKSPKTDAQRVGASDILPKPYSEADFVSKVQQMLGIRTGGEPPVTSNELFSDLLDEADKPAKKPVSKSSSDAVDKMLADTLAGVMPQRRTSPGTQPNPAQPKPAARTSDLDKRLSDTLSGLEKSARRTVAVPMPHADPAPANEKPASRPATPPAPTPSAPTPPAAAPAPAAAAQPAVPQPAAPQPPAAAAPQHAAPPAPAQEQKPDRVPLSQPVIPAARPPVVVVEEEENGDGSTFGQYLLVEKIATGGMAEVWKARMRGVEGFQKIVAIKKILPHLSDNQDFIEMFVDEAKLAAQLSHNNIIHIYDLGKIQSSYYIAMEYIDGFDLKTILRRGAETGQPMAVELALFVASKVAAALDYAHRKRDFEDREMGLVHRDVSPQNVLISQEGDIKLCDFGIAKAASKASHTQAGALKGKLQYMSPEQAWGRNIDRRSDIFALATVLFEMLTGNKLFTGDNEISILEQVREARVQPPSLYNEDVTPEIDRIVLKALQKDPSERYDTAGEMARDLDAILYSFKPTPTSADLAIYMHRLSSPQPELEAAAPEPVSAPPAPAAKITGPGTITNPGIITGPGTMSTATPKAAPAPTVAIPLPVETPAPAPAPRSVAEPAVEPERPAYTPVEIEEPKKKSPLPLIAAAVVVLALLGGAAFMLMRKPAAPDAPAPTTAVAASTMTTPAALPATATTASAPVALDTTGTLTPTTTAAAIDPSLVDQEVQKRLAAERARLEAQAQQQQQQQQQQQRAETQAAAPAQSAPAPVQQARAEPVAAPPVTATQQAPPPVTQSVAQERAPEPAPQPQVQRAREGDLVATGTPGLIPPRLVRRGVVNYPPAARMQRVEGTVITSVLVSESGQVLDVKVLRGVNRAGGLNEAATQAMRRSTFAAGTKDGVRVKSWLTVPVEFKL